MLLVEKLGRYWDDVVSDNSKVIDKIKTYPVTDDYANKVFMDLSAYESYNVKFC